MPLGDDVFILFLVAQAIEFFVRIVFSLFSY